MKIAIIGTGHVGGALGGRWARDGHEIIFGSRNPEGEKAQNLLRLVPGNVRVAGNTEAVSAAEVVLLATPWSATRDTLTRAGITNLAGKIVIDAVNPIGPDGLSVGGTAFKNCVSRKTLPALIALGTVKIVSNCGIKSLGASPACALYRWLLRPRAGKGHQAEVRTSSAVRIAGRLRSHSQAVWASVPASKAASPMYSPSALSNSTPATRVATLTTR
jgi:hypothetical protein